MSIQLINYFQLLPCLGILTAFTPIVLGKGGHTNQSALHFLSV